VDELAGRFEARREYLRGVAYRMLGSRAEADDAVQETWLRLTRVDAAGIANLTGWLTTVVSRLCLDALRARAARREDLVADPAPAAADDDPEAEAVRADEVGRALLVVLDRLGPAERVAFVLHDMFAVPFDEIAPIVSRTPVAAKKLASRARARVRGTPSVDGAELARQRGVVEAFLAAARAGDLDAVLAVLAPDVVRRADAAAVGPDRAGEVRGARSVADEIAVFGRTAAGAELALVDGTVGVLVAPGGRLRLAVTVTLTGDRIAGYELIGDEGRLARLDLAVLT
jgi:RNA polymerase sigma-70 factor (ECF subfamily)